MSIMRSFTTRRKQPELDPNTPNFLGRAASQRSGRPVPRAKISAPVALLSTTNVLSFNAPDIAGTQPIEHRDVSVSSSEESDSSGSIHSQETDPTDVSSVESSPTASRLDENHLSQYFKAVLDADSRLDRTPSMASQSPVVDASPAVPRRAPSHSKRAHEALSRKLSVQRARSPSAPGHAVSCARESADLFNSRAAFVEAPRDHPFGQDVSSLDAVAEECGATPSQMTDGDEALYLQTRGLAHVSAADYLSEIDSLKLAYLDDSSPAIPDFSGWI